MDFLYTVHQLTRPGNSLMYLINSSTAAGTVLLNWSQTHRNRKIQALQLNFIFRQSLKSDQSDHPEVSLTLPDFSISVDGSACKYLSTLFPFFNPTEYKFVYILPQIKRKYKKTFENIAQKISEIFKNLKNKKT